MADYKTAEQYVVEKVEYLERELDNLKIEHKIEIDEHIKEFEVLREELHDAYVLLDMLRDFIEVRNDAYFGNYIYFNNILGRENPEAVSRLMEYFDMRPEEDE